MSIDEMSQHYKSGKSIPDISKLSGISRSSVRLKLLSFGVPLRTRKDGISLSAWKISKLLKGTKRVFSEKWKNNIRLARLRHSAKHAKGFRITPRGYIEITKGPNKGRLMHDVVMESSIARRLLPSEVVHHRDRNKQNNELKNLQLMTQSEHTKLHRREDGRGKR